MQHQLCRWRIIRQWNVGQSTPDAGYGYLASPSYRGSRLVHCCNRRRVHGRLFEVSNASTSSEEYRSFQLLHFGTMFKFDMFVRHHTAYDQMVLSRAVTVELFSGTPARCYTAEDILIQKLRWFELRNRVSDRQWNDIVQILEVQDGRLDNPYLELWARNFEVIDLLSSARSQIRA